jgi:agmatinase
MHNVLEKIPGVAKLVQVGIRDFCAQEYEYTKARPSRIKVFYDREVSFRVLRGESFAHVAQEIVDSLPQKVYLSFDIDGLDPKYCPHTGTPVPGGLEFNQLLAIIKVLAESGRQLVGLDLVEVTPGEKGDEWDANVGMRLLYKLTATCLGTQGLLLARE